MGGVTFLSRDLAALCGLDLLRRIGGRLWLSIFSHTYSTFGNCVHRSLQRVWAIGFHEDPTAFNYVSAYTTEIH